jgi:hypothetical protein
MRGKKARETRREERESLEAQQQSVPLGIWLVLADVLTRTRRLPTLGKEKAGDLRSEIRSLLFSLLFPRLYYCPFRRLFKPPSLFPDTWRYIPLVCLFGFSIPCSVLSGRVPRSSIRYLDTLTLRHELRKGRLSGLPGDRLTNQRIWVLL